ncbi:MULTISPECIES: hypothetical protein [Mesoflavibacter]|uniref:Uncharacterized protein n=1 Tax=Mesoflavibacter profundi TaxID=2708110 RepID=A0ABT4S0G5_9FLAO|nr:MULTISPECIES: hypothetical protein [Mesoflavibacter]MDA0177388.1 hypothetical protein [Mesoflavibacter profundi]
MKLSQRHIKKIKWTTRMAFSSLGILIIALLINEFRVPLFGIKKGYAPHNFGFNFTFFLPSMAIAIGLGFAVIGRTIKHWKTWTNLNKKLVLIGLSIPSIGILSFVIIKMFSL